MQASSTCACLYVLFKSVFKSKSGQHILTLRAAAASTDSGQAIRKPNQEEVWLKPKIGVENFKRAGPLGFRYLLYTCLSIIHTGKQDDA